MKFGFVPEGSVPTLAYHDSSSDFVGDVSSVSVPVL